ncbi:cellulose synthase [Sphaerimonospora cavernae]|uniref:Cellulose synthase n=1 Tax=Sphaerimonospora cavernae TaxID=1740611 RepID=A0ABV6U5P6_9ACTN
MPGWKNAVRDEGFVMTYDQIAWLPLCAGLTAVGIVLSFLAFRRRGATAGLRATAWSLLPLAAYLTGAHRTLWDIGSAAVRFVAGLVLSPVVWAGVVLAGLSAVLFVVSGAMRGRALSRARGAGTTGKTEPRQVERPATTGPATTGPATTGPATTGSIGSGKSGPVKSGPVKSGPVKSAPPSDDFSDIEEILKRRGIS